jgi:hypothetical protein
MAHLDKASFSTLSPIDPEHADDLLDAEFADDLMKWMENGSDTGSGGEQFSLCALREIK